MSQSVSYNAPSLNFGAKNTHKPGWVALTMKQHQQSEYTCLGSNPESLNQEDSSLTSDLSLHFHYFSDHYLKGL